MGNTIIKAGCFDQRLVLLSAPTVASGGRNEDAVEFEFCPLWDGFSKTAVFYRTVDAAYHAVITDGRCIIPHEVLAQDGDMYFGVFGVKGDITRTSEVIKYKITKGAITEGTKPSDPTPDIYEQLLSYVAKLNQLKPEFANATSECTDESKVYVLPDGYLYAYMNGSWTNTGHAFVPADYEDRIIDLEDALIVKEQVVYDLESMEYTPGYMNGDGSITNHPVYATSDFIEVTEGEEIVYNNLRTPATYTVYFATYDAEENLIKDFAGVDFGVASSDLLSGTYKVESGVKYMRFVFSFEIYTKVRATVEKTLTASRMDEMSTEFENAQKAQNERIDAQDKRIDELEQKEEAARFEYVVTDVTELSPLTEGVALSTKGEEWAYANTLTTDFIPTDNIVSVEIADSGITNRSCVLACYDADKKFIAEKSLIAEGATSGSWVLVEGKVEITADVKYIRVCKATDRVTSYDRYIRITCLRSIEEDYAETKKNVEALSGNQWAGKKWYAFGTSITDTDYPLNSDTGEPTGKYVPYLAELSGLDYVDCGIAGGTIAKDGVYGGTATILNKILSTDLADADLITIEGFVNDYACAVALGAPGDTESNSLCGALYQALKHCLETSNATVVLLTEHTGKKAINPANGVEANYCFDKLNNGLTQMDYNKKIIEMAQYVGVPCIDAGSKSQINCFHPEYLADWIHHSYLGGKQYAETIWDELKHIHPNTDVVI